MFRQYEETNKAVFAFLTFCDKLSLKLREREI